MEKTVAQSKQERTNGERLSVKRVLKGSYSQALRETERIRLQYAEAEGERAEGRSRTIEFMQLTYRKHLADMINKELEEVSPVCLDVIRPLILSIEAQGRRRCKQTKRSP